MICGAEEKLRRKTPPIPGRPAGGGCAIKVARRILDHGGFWLGAVVGAVEGSERGVVAGGCNSINGAVGGGFAEESGAVEIAVDAFHQSGKGILAIAVKQGIERI